MAIDTENMKKLDLKVVHTLVSDLFKINPIKYWFDFIASAIIGWVFLGVQVIYDLNLTLSIFYFLISVLAFYRALCFLHEITHLRENDLPFFSYAWALLIGIPLLMPSFLYREIHQAHHHKNKYGTQLDGEYVTEFTTSFKYILYVFIGNLLAPIFTVFRFAVLGPISFCFPSIRHWVKLNASALSLKFPFKREIASEKSKLWLMEELLSIIFIWSVIIAIVLNILPASVILYYSYLIISISVLNSIRAIGATHRYSSHGNSMSFHNQFLDSFNVDSSRIDSILLCPVGLRFHALHHLFPGLPYHSLAEAHNRIKSSLSIESDYHQTNINSVWHGWFIILSSQTLVTSEQLIIQEK